VFVLLPGLSSIEPRLLGLMLESFIKPKGSCVVVVREENGRIAVAYNEDDFSSTEGVTNNHNGFIVSFNKDGRLGARFDQTEHALGMYNHPFCGPFFVNDLAIASNCNENLGAS
jgi:hypothetical protein